MPVLLCLIGDLNKIGYVENTLACVGGVFFHVSDPPKEPTVPTSKYPVHKTTYLQNINVWRQFVQIHMLKPTLYKWK